MKKTFFVRLILLLLLFACLLSAGNAESLFSLLATQAPSETPAPAVVNAFYTDDLFSLLATAAPTPAPSAAPAQTKAPAATEMPAQTQTPAQTEAPAQTHAPDAASPFWGLGYGDMTGKEADRIQPNEAEGTVEYIYENVTADDLNRYGVFLHEHGCQAQPLDVTAGTAAAYAVYSEEAKAGFLVIYETGLRRLTIGCFPDAAAQQEETAPAETASPAAVCPDCHRGLCKDCHGSGFFKCSDCGGLGRCPVCHGNRGSASPGYGGIGTGTYTPCGACGGSGRCQKCDGRGRVDCSECNHGICKTCGGHYVLAP